MEAVARELLLFVAGCVSGAALTALYVSRTARENYGYDERTRHSQPRVERSVTDPAITLRPADDASWIQSLDRLDRPGAVRWTPPAEDLTPVVSAAITPPAIEDEPSLALRLYAEDTEGFRERFRPVVVEPDIERSEREPHDLLLRQQTDGPYWLVSVSGGIGLVFPRPKRAFGRGMMHYGAARELFEIRGFQDGVRYRRTAVHAPARVIAEGDIWRRHTRGVIEVNDGEPDE